MKIRRFAHIILLSSTLALTFAASPVQRALAACYNAQKAEVPCEEEKDGERERKARPTTAPVASPTPTPTPTPTHKPKPTPTDTPDPAQLAILCASLPPAGNGIPDAGVNEPDPAAPAVATRLPFSPLLLGGGGLLGTLVLGVLLGRSLTRPRMSGGASPAAGGSPTGPDLGSMTVEDAAQMMLLLTSTDAQRDMREMLGEMQNENKRKRAVRQFLDTAKTPQSGNELPDSTGKELQDGMERMSRFQDALSNALKKAQDTADSITKNPK